MKNNVLHYGNACSGANLNFFHIVVNLLQFIACNSVLKLYTEIVVPFCLVNPVVPNLFCLTGHLFFMEGIEGHKVNFLHSLPSSPSFFFPSFPSRPTARGSGGTL